MKLFASKNTISVAAALALEEAALPYDLILLDFSNAEQTQPAYLKTNPKGRVPALITDEGIITETGAILEYIHALAPDAGLIPDDPALAAKMREAMYYLASTMHVNHAHKLRGERWADHPDSWADMRAKTPETMAVSCDYIEQNVLRGPFVLGGNICLADVYLYTISTWLEGDGVDVSAYPKLHAFRVEMAKRPSVEAVTRLGLL